MIERRREPRRQVSWPLVAAGVSGGGEGRVIDVSLCGVLFEADVELEEKDLVLLRISVDSCTTVDCVGQVVRKTARETRNAYGVDIRYISAADRQKLSFALMLIQETALQRA